MTATNEKIVRSFKSFPFARLQLGAVVVAIASALGLITVMSSADGYIASAMRDQDAQLAAISERAERLQAFSRYVRKASVTSSPEPELPFGGFVGASSAIEPGATLKLGHPDLAGHLLEVVSARKIAPSINLAVATAQKIDLMLVTGRVIGTEDSHLVRFLVAVTPEKPSTGTSTDRGIDHQLL